ncbi:MAG TPA: segregation/condensation protein A [bacterium]|nr:segregation/condensation protein A [bacterium]
MAEPETYRVRLESFEGPLDLLLYLIRKNEVEIYDIPIALIVEQYMAYLDLMRSLNLDVAGDFIVMAATLSHIKSQLLLPRTGEEALAEEEGEDPRAELVRRLLEYQRYKEAAQGLMARPVLGRDVFVRPPSQELIEEAARAAGISPMTFAEVGVFELLEAFKEVMDRAKVTNWHEVTMERISIMDRINDILALLRDVDSLAFDQLFTSVTDKAMIIATFLALLELIRLRVIKAHQERPLGPIHLVRAVTIDDQWLSDNLPHFDQGID